MKFAAHPLVVAVALGLLGPSALESMRPEAPRARTSASDLTDADVPDAGEIAQAAAAFAAARDSI
ncbi:MAG: hypothetical protein ACI8PZ_002826 [Myxococcota bacterium]